jgi:diguanylate cyclase (GGDEF)-like protein
LEKDSSQELIDAYAQNLVTETNVFASGLALGDVNKNLANEIVALTQAKDELTEAKVQLAAARDDLEVSRGQADEAMRQIALEDPLTHLPNRFAFEQRLELALSEARRHGWELAVFSIDVDQFTSINDSHGRDVGDEVLRMVAARLAFLVPEDDMVSHWGGDEFVCLLLEVESPASLTRLAKKMLASIAEPCIVRQEVLEVQVSIGMAIFPAHGSSAEILLRNADLAMNQAKGEKDRVVLFEYPEQA